MKDREEAIKRAKQAAPLDRHAVAQEMRELDALRHTHPELSIRIYHRMNELLAMLSEAEEPLERAEDARNVLSAAEQAPE